MAGDFTTTGLELQLKGLSNFLSGLGKVDKGVQQTGDRLRDSKGRFIGAGKGAKKFGASLGGAMPNVGRFSGALPSIGKNLLSVGAIAGGAALAGIGALAVGIGAVGAASVKTAISFESAFAGVVKTTDGLSSSIGVLNDAGKELREGFVNLSKEVPIAFEELAAIGELGGQLGIGKDALLDFTETVAALGVATNLTTEEAGSGLARMSNIFNVAQADMGTNIAQLGSTIVALGNNFATTERDILAFGERLAGAGAIAGLTQADVLSIGAAMSSVGVAAEAGGTATQKVLLSINNAVVGAATGFVDYSKQIDKNVGKMSKLNAESARLEGSFPGLQAEILAQKEAFIAAGGSAEEFGRQLGDKTRQKALEVAEGLQDLQVETELLRKQHGQPVDSKMLATFAKTAGLSATEFQEAWETDASGAFTAFVEGLGKQGDEAVNTLSDLGLEDQRLIRSFLSLSGAGDLLARTLDTGNTAFEENTALAKEAAQRYATTESQIAILKNTLRAIGDTIGSRLLPIFNRLISTAKDFIDKWSKPIEKALDKVFGAFERFGVRGAAISVLGLLGLDPSQISEVLGFADQIGAVIEGVFTTVNDIIAGFQSGGVSGAFGALFSSEAAEGALQSVLDFITGFLAENWPIVQAQLAEWGNQFFGWVNETVVPAIPETLSSIITAITTWASEQLPLIQASTQEWATGFWEWVQGVVSSAGESLAGIVAAVGLWAGSSETQAQLTAMGIALGDALVVGIQNLAENQGRMVEILTQVVTGLGIGVLAVAGLLIAIGAQIVAGIIAGIIESITGGEVEVAMISNLGTMLVDIASQVLTIASLIGTNILLGISQGILDGIAALTTTVMQIGTIITETVKSVLGISSPSTIFMQFGIDIIQGMINGILSLAGTLTETIGTVLGSLFGGGGEEAAAPTVDFNPAEMLAGIEAVNTGIESVNTALNNITLITLPLLSETLLITAMFITEQLLLLLEMGILPVDMALIFMYTSTLPTLQSVTLSVTATMVAAFRTVIDVVNELISVIEQLIALLQELADVASNVFKKITSAITSLRTSLSGLKMSVDAITKAWEKMGNAAADAIAKADSAVDIAASKAGLGFSQGVGFAAGTPGNTGSSLGLGFRVPPGFPNDSFPMRVESGEEVLVTPRGMSIDSLIFSRLSNLIGGNQVSDRPVVINNFNEFNMVVNTGASPQAVINQYNVMRGMLGT